MYHLLSIHPTILSRVRGEHDEFFGTTLESTITALNTNPQVLKKLTLTSAVLKEVLRLFPIGASLRQAKPGTTLSYKGRDFPVANHLICVLSPQMQRNPEFWTKPQAFEPDLWLDDGLSIPGWGDWMYQIHKLTAKPKHGMPMAVKLRDT
jgi:cytochrome P450